MKVLVACEFTGTVRRAFRKRGHEAFSCDLLPAEDKSKYHYQGDISHYLTRRSTPRFDLIIAHPPCTYLSVSGIHWNTRRPERAALTEQALSFARMFIEPTFINCEMIATENPISIISTRIRKPDQIIQPWQFGHDASKATCLWLRNLPKLVHTHYISPRYVCSECGFVDHNGWPGFCSRCCGTKVRERWANQTDSGQNRLPPSDHRWADRSRTYEGIAEAMADQWGDPV